MQTVLVVFNPVAGMKWRKRDSELHALLRSLADAGVKTLTTTTRGPQRPPGELFKGLDDFDTVLAVGGDGTVNEVVQALMWNGRDAALGVVPFGCGNLLAKELGAGRRVEELVDALLDSDPRPCGVGCIEQEKTGERRYWVAAAGVGADARVICALSSSAKARYGIAAYYAESARQLLFSREPFPTFALDFEEARTGRKRTEFVTQVVAEKIGYFGKFLEPGDAPPLAPEELRIVLFKTARHSAFLGYGFRLVAALATKRTQGTQLKDVEVARVRGLRCYHADPASVGTQFAYGPQKTLAEVDGELFGELPVRIFTVERQIRVLKPQAPD